MAKQQQQVVSIPLTSQRPCAWCLDEQHETPNENDSHSICPRHEGIIDAQLEARHARKQAEKKQGAAR